MTDQELVDALCEIESGLTCWELDFVESIASQVEAGGALSARQREVADRILEDRG